jgi:hypothetical protein|eukprot:jgi/Chrpa1/21240/Chrysochromulina_OHIO_Genome00008306-RA
MPEADAQQVDGEGVEDVVGEHHEWATQCAAVHPAAGELKMQVACTLGGSFKHSDVEDSIADERCSWRELGLRQGCCRVQIRENHTEPVAATSL